MFAHCPSSSKLAPGGNTGEVKAARKGTGYPASLCRWLRRSVLSNRHSPTYGIVYGTNLYLFTCRSTYFLIIFMEHTVQLGLRNHLGIVKELLVLKCGQTKSINKEPVQEKACLPNTIFHKFSNHSPFYSFHRTTNSWRI